MEISRNKEINIIFWTISILVFFLPIIYNPWGYDSYAGPRIIFLIALLTFVLILYLFSVLRTEKIYYKKHLIFPLVLSFLFFALVSTLVSNSRFVSFLGTYQRYEGFLTYLTYFILFYIGFLFFNTVKFKKLLIIISLSVLLITVIGLFDGFLHFIRGQPLILKRLSSTLGNPSYMGCYLVLTTPLIFSLTRSKLLSKFRTILIIILVLALVSLVFTFSRGAWLGFLFSVLLLTLMNIKKIFSYFQKNKLFLVYLVLIAMIIGITLWYLSFGREGIERLVSIFGYSEGTVKGRIDLWRQVFSLIKNNFWLGVGPDNLLSTLPKFYFLPEWSKFGDIHVDKAHNEFLQIWATCGIFGLISYLGIIGKFFKNIFLSLKKIENDRRVFLEGILASSVGYLVVLMFHFSSVEIAPIFWLTIGVGLSLSSTTGLMLFQFKKISGFKKTILKFCALLIIIFFTWYSIKFLLADFYFNKGLILLDKKENTIAQKNFMKAIDYNPKISHYYLALAGSLRKENPEGALEIISQGIQNSPFESRLWMQRADTYLLIAEQEKDADVKIANYLLAKKSLIKTIELYPILAEAHLKLGIIYIIEGKNQEGVSEWLKVIELDPKESLAYYNLAFFYHQLGDKQKAIEFYQKVLIIDPENVQAKKGLQTLLSQ